VTEIKDQRSSRLGEAADFCPDASGIRSIDFTVDAHNGCQAAHVYKNLSSTAIDDVAVAGMALGWRIYSVH
jgi:hypothetical protein